MKVNTRQVETAKPKDKRYKIADGGGLYLEVLATGSKNWRMKYRRSSDRKEERLALGVWPTETLAQTIAKLDEAKKLLVQSIDPKAEQKEAQAENSGAYTFETVAREWPASNKRWSEDHRSRVLRYLELYIFPQIGSSDIRQFKTSHLLAPIKKVIASAKNNVAQRLQQRVTTIMHYAVQNDYINSNPASDMAGALSTTKPRHYPALSSSRFPEFLPRLAAYRGRVMTRIAVELSLLTFLPSSELRFTRWDEFDFDESLWRVPAKRDEIKYVRYSYRGMKMKAEHNVPLIWQAMGYDTKTEVCGNGFKTMARVALEESRLWSKDAIEWRLSHSERSNVRAAYMHISEHFDERRLMVQWGAEFLSGNTHTLISPYEFAKS
ncbi:tyrosine-type recombinase/integrase [Enterobacter sp. ECC-249]|uniref:tyrosine-type recombinase/integrase n=1 Tax=Enterobacter sp. ECC-249 TaxID=3116481 RepID=UPI0037544BCB